MYKALITFSGKISMVKGQVKEIKDDVIIKDLLKAKYIEEVKTIEKEEVKITKNKKKEK